MAALRGAARTLCAALVSLPLAWVADMLARRAYEAEYGATATEQFLYYWLPNQLPVFLFGLVAYECITALHRERLAARIRPHATALLWLSGFGFASLALLPWPRLPVPEAAFLTSHVLAAIAFGGGAVALALRPMPLVANRTMVHLGRASFSAYLLHFAVIEAVRRLLPHHLLAARGVEAAAVGGAAFLLVLVVPGLVAQASYRLVELPAIRYGARIAGASLASRAPSPTMRGTPAIAIAAVHPPDDAP